MEHKAVDAILLKITPKACLKPSPLTDLPNPAFAEQHLAREVHSIEKSFVHFFHHCHIFRLSLRIRRMLIMEYTETDSVL
jgi:hypothetical protein